MINYSNRSIGCLIIISTLRFRALPSAVVLIACGLVAAKPEAVTRRGSIAVSDRISRLVTDAARDTDKSQFDG